MFKESENGKPEHELHNDFEIQPLRPLRVTEPLCDSVRSRRSYANLCRPETKASFGDGSTYMEPV